NFGVFEVKQRKPRKARNPRTGDRVDVAAKNVVTFQPGKTMEKRVREEAKPVEPKKKKAKKMKPATGPKPTQPHDGKPVEGLPELKDTNLIAKANGTGVKSSEPKPEPVGAGAGSNHPGSES